MKKFFQLLFFVFFSICAYSQTYNISIDGSISTIGDTIPKDTRFGIFSYIYNNSTAPVDNLLFKWYISTDSILSANDLQIDEFLTFTSGSTLKAGLSANVSSALSVIPGSYPVGCGFFIIMKITSSYTETNYLDNVAYTKVCVRDQRVDLNARISLVNTVFFRDVNNKQVVVNESIKNDGELASVVNTNYVVKVGTSPDHTVGNIYTKPQIHKPIIAANATASMQDTFDISTLANGDYYVFNIIDPANLIKEPKGNNAAVARFKIANLIPSTGAYNMPKLDSVKFISTCNSVIYDDGGLLGDYSPNGNSALYLYPAVKGAKVRLTIKSSKLADISDEIILGYPTQNGYYSETQTYSSLSLYEDFLSYNSEGLVMLQFKSGATKQAAGFEIEVKCSYGSDYKPANIVSKKPVYVDKLDTVSFSFDLRNVGPNEIKSLKYQYGLTKEANLSKPLFTSAIGTSGTLDLNSNLAYTPLKIANNKIPLSNLSIKDTGTYYIYVKAGVGQNDTDTTDNVIFYPVKIIKIDTLNNKSVNFKNNTTQYISTCNLTLYDDGGPYSSYSNNFNGKVFLFPAESDKIIKIEATNLLSAFEKNTASTAYLDILSINNGQTEALAYTIPVKNDLSYIASTLPMKAAMLKFVSNATVPAAGFELNVTCVQNRPDFKVQSFKVGYFNATVGENLRLTPRFTNNGTSPNPVSPTPYLIYVSPTKNITDAVLTSSPRTWNFTNSISSTDTLWMKNIKKPGKYYFIAFLDPANTLAEADRTNNLMIDSLFINLDYPKRIPIGEVSKTITSCNDTISDHSGADANYKNDIYGNMVIAPAIPGQRLKVSFLDFDTEANQAFLYVYNGNSIYSPLIGSYSGNSLPPDIISPNSSGTLTFQFRTSGSSNTRSGFSFKTSCIALDKVNVPVKGSQVVKTCEVMVFDDGGEVANYSNNVDGKITFVPSEVGKYISLQFNQFELANDVLEIYDGEDVNATLLTALTSPNFTFPLNIKASSKNPTGALTLRFKSDANSNGAGFASLVSCVNDPQKETLFPYAGKRSIVSCGDTIYDNGGSKVNGYSPANGMITIKPNNANEKVKLDFIGTPTFNINSNFQIFDGDSTDAPLIISSKTATLKSVVAANSKGSLTIYYVNVLNRNRDDNFSFATSCVASNTYMLPVLKDTIVKGCNLSIFDNGGKDGAYSNNLNKSITIYPDVNTKKIKLTANGMAIHESDTLYVFDGENTNSTLIGKFNGTLLPHVLISSNGNKSGALTLKLVSDNSLNADGFSFFATCIDSVSSFVIPLKGNRVVTACTGDVSDYIAEYGDYFNNSDGSLTIMPDQLKNRVKLSVFGIDIEQDKDFVYIYDGPSVSSNLLASYTGVKLTPRTLTSSSVDGSLTIRFVSNASVTSSGFKFSLGCLLPEYSMPLTGSRSITACEGVVSDDGGIDATYSNNADGTMVIYPGINGQMAKLSFKDFNTVDNLSIYNGTTINAPLLGQFAGSAIPDDIIANNSSGALTLNFKTDASNVSSGFNANLSCVLVTGEQEYYNEIEEQFQLVPNPAQHFILVNKSGKNEVYNVAGILILTTENQEVDISNLPSGIYRLVNTHEGKTSAKTFIKN